MQVMQQGDRWCRFDKSKNWRLLLGQNAKVLILLENPFWLIDVPVVNSDNVSQTFKHNTVWSQSSPFKRTYLQIHKFPTVDQAEGQVPAYLIEVPAYLPELQFARNCNIKTTVHHNYYVTLKFARLFSL